MDSNDQSTNEINEKRDKVEGKERWDIKAVDGKTFGKCKKLENSRLFQSDI